MPSEGKKSYRAFLSSDTLEPEILGALLSIVLILDMHHWG
jgi:hypothetical protein